jgi:hypothetical protein
VPLRSLSPPRRRRALWLLGASTVIFGVAALPSLHTMDSHGAGILQFEFVRTSARAQQFLSEWGSEGRSAARTSLWLDYPFLVSYALFLSLACVTVAGRAERAGRRRWAAIGAALAWGALAAGAFDAVENACLLLILGGHPVAPYPAAASVCASAKFLLSTSAVLYALIGIAIFRSPRPDDA